MIITVNTNGILIDLSGEDQSVIDRFGTPCLTMLAGSIDTISIVPFLNLGMALQIEDSISDNFYIGLDEITSINGATTFADIKAVHVAVSNALLNIG